MHTEIIHMVRAVAAGDVPKAQAYARLLADNLDKEGQHKDSTRIRRALGEHTTQGRPVTLDGDAG